MVARWGSLLVALSTSYLLPTMSQPPTPSEPAPSADPSRWASPVQPEPKEFPNKSRTERWGVKAHVGQYGTGNAARDGKKPTFKEWDTAWQYFPTVDDAVLWQQDYINRHLHPKVSLSRLELSEDHSQPPFGFSWPFFRVLAEVLGARAERHEKTRFRSAILSDNEIRIMSACRR